MSFRLIALGLCAVTLAAYAQVGGHEFLNWDDQVYVTDNVHVQHGLTWSGVRWAFTNTLTGNWHPLTWLSHMLDCQLFGIRSGAHHLISAALHAVVTVLLFLVLRRLTGDMWPAAFAAALFGLHPLRVESVAWVSERKDVVAGLFWMLALAAYARYVERATRGRYAAVLGMLILGLLAKPMAVTLPFVLLLLDAWPLRRMPSRSLRALFWEKLPMFAVVAGMSVVALAAQSAGGTVASVDVVPIGARLGNALVAYVAYPLAMVWPAGLAFFYPHPIVADPQFSLTSPVAVGSGLLLATITVLAVRARKPAPYLAVGWFWYLGTALPVIGIVQLGAQARADRYTYIPSIGLAVMITWAACGLWQRWRLRRATLATAALIVLGLLTGLTWRQVATWRDNETLCLQALRVTSANFVAHANLGSEYGDRGELSAAAEHLQAAVRINPRYAPALCNLGVTRFKQGSSGDARQYLERALQLVPTHVPTLQNLGLIELRAGNLSRGAELLERVLDVDPDHVAALYNLGLVALKRHDAKAARARFERVLQLDPTHAPARAAVAQLQR